MSRASLFLVISLLAAALAGGACGGTDAENAEDATPADAGVETLDAGSGEVDADAGAADSGVPAERFGLEGFCDHYKECGGTYDATAQACIDRSLRYWGDCRRAELDAWSECMKSIPCEDWNPDAYSPANVGRCEEEWQTLRSTAACN